MKNLNLIIAFAVLAHLAAHAVVAGEAEGTTLYMTFGQDRIRKGDRDKAPRVHLLTEEQFTDEAPIPIASYQVVGDSSYNGAFVARQSYITFGQFDALRSSVKQKLYISGQGFANLKGSGSGSGTGGTGGGTSPLVTGDYLTLDGSNGVFYADITKGGVLSTAVPATVLPDGATEAQQGARFNMSWISPVEHHHINCPERPLNAARVEATYNIGLVGLDEEHTAVTSGTVEIVRGKGNTKGNEVFCTPDRTMPVSNYNQADWFIRDKYIGRNGSDGKPLIYTLVVDLEPHCNTVSLLYFQPNPTVSATGTSVEPIDLTAPGQPLRVYGATADRLSGETGAGPVVLSRVASPRSSASPSTPTSSRACPTSSTTPTLPSNTSTCAACMSVTPRHRESTCAGKARQYVKL